MGGGDRLFQANPSKFGPQPPSILYATQPTKDTVDGTEASVEMQSSLNGAESDVLMNTAVVVVEKSALTQDVVRMIKATLQVQHCDIACLFLVSFLSGFQLLLKACWQEELKQDCNTHNNLNEF